MADPSVDDKQEEDQNPGGADEVENPPHVQADRGSVAVGGINIGRDLSGEVNIAAGDIYKGYTAEQVSLLLTQITSNYQRKPFDGRCPYKGLEVFEEEDADLFFGRERLVEDLVNSVKESRTVFITGPSGSGKSSLVRAGLIHILKEGAIQELHSERWLYATIKPGREPISNLALAFGRLKRLDLADYFQAHADDINILNKSAESALSENQDQRFVLFIDQFEEVFTQVSQETERLTFLNILAQAGAIENGRVIVLFAMRSDFISNCATYPQVNALLNRQFVQIGAMQPEELVSAIALPAKKVGLPVEEELIARIINDMKGEPGSLPLMQFALKELFEARQAQGGETVLTLEAYLARGGIQKMLARHADDTFNQLSLAQQELARFIFSGLIELGKGRQDTRRTALFDELVPASANAGDVETVVQKLADARLVMTDEQAGRNTVTISHEKLIDAWPWLKKLVNENRDVIALQNEINNDAKEWDDHRWDASYLYTGARLGNALEQLEAKKLALSGTGYEFVQAGSARQRRNRVAVIAGVSALLLLMLVAVIVFAWQSSRNAELAKVSRAGELAAQSVSQRENQFDLSLLLSVEAFRTAETNRTKGVLLDNTQSNPQLLQYLQFTADTIFSLNFSLDGKTLVSESCVEEAFVDCAKSQIILLNIEATQATQEVLAEYDGLVRYAAISPDRKMLAFSTSDDTIILWDISTQQTIGQPISGRGDTSMKVAFSPDSKTLAYGSDQVILWNIASRQPIGEPLDGHDSNITSLAFSPDSKILASASDKILLWDVTTRQTIGQPLGQQNGLITSLAFSPDGKMLASAENRIMLWDLASGESIAELAMGPSDIVTSLAFSPDGKILASGSCEQVDFSCLRGKIKLWNAAPHQPIGESFEAKRPSNLAKALALSEDGSMVALANNDHTITLQNVASGKPIRQPFTGYKGPVTSLAFSPDGKILASESDQIMFWSVASGQPAGQPLKVETTPQDSLVFSPDGKILALVRPDEIILWNLASGQPIGRPIKEPSHYETRFAFSRDSKTIAVTSTGSDEVGLWNVTDGHRIGQPLKVNGGAVLSLAFSPDSKILALGSDEIRLLDVPSRQFIGQPLRGGSTYPISSLAFSPDGKTLASGTCAVVQLAFCSLGEIILWDVASSQPIGQPVKEHTGYVDGITFRPDGKMITTASDDLIMIIWDMDPKSWANLNCQRAGRNFTQAEWQDYFLTEEYRATCPQWPLGSNLTATPNPTP